MPSVTEQLKTQHELERTDPWAAWLVKIVGAERAAQILAITRCARCQGRVRLAKVYTRDGEKRVEYRCARCGRTTPVDLPPPTVDVPPVSAVGVEP